MTESVYDKHATTTRHQLLKKPDASDLINFDVLAHETSTHCCVLREVKGAVLRCCTVFRQTASATLLGAPQRMRGSSGTSLTSTDSHTLLPRRAPPCPDALVELNAEHHQVKHMSSLEQSPHRRPDRPLRQAPRLKTRPRQVPPLKHAWECRADWLNTEKDQKALRAHLLPSHSMSPR